MAQPGSLPQSQPPLGMSWVPGQCRQHVGSPAVTFPGTSTPAPRLLVQGPLLLFQGSVQCLALQIMDRDAQVAKSRLHWRRTVGAEASVPV